ncbi:MAG: hypothetical protein V3R36_03835, partial [Dehalococcoidales bacterium]
LFGLDKSVTTFHECFDRTFWHDTPPFTGCILLISIPLSIPGSYVVNFLDGREIDKVSEVHKYPEAVHVIVDGE